MDTLDGGTADLDRTGPDWLLSVHDGCEGACVVLTRERLIMLLADQGIDATVPEVER